MKKLFIILMLALLAITFKVKAGEPAYSYQPLSNTNFAIMPAGSTSNAMAVIDCSKTRNVGLSLWNTGTNTAVSISASVDGTRYDTNHWNISWTNALGSPYGMLTNIDTTGYGNIRIDGTVTVGALISTNDWKYSIKIPAN